VALGAARVSRVSCNSLDPNGAPAVHNRAMLKRKISEPATCKKPAGGEAQPVAVKRLRRVAQSTLFVAGVTASRMMAEANFVKMKLFSPGLVDRLQAPITRFHE